eukprot:3434850-Prymnesium_polylepis.1
MSLPLADGHARGKRRVSFTQDRENSAEASDDDGGDHAPVTAPVAAQKKKKRRSSAGTAQGASQASSVDTQPVASQRTEGLSQRERPAVAATPRRLGVESGTIRHIALENFKNH